MQDRHVVVIGAGIAGLVAALTLARSGIPVTLLDKEAAPGGKMREMVADGARIDAGPTVLTMRWVLDELFDDLGLSLADHVTLTKAGILARHSWEGGGALDLHATREASADAIGDFAGAGEARGYRAFAAEAERMFAVLRRSFIEAAEPSMTGLIAAQGWFGLPNLMAIRPFATLWDALGGHFRDPRLRQLFGRYATYCGSSPFLAPATLMLVAHVESEGVFYVEGGMHRLAAALAALAGEAGATLRYEAEASRIEVSSSDVVEAVHLAGGERIPCDTVIAAGDVAALAAGHLGEAVQRVAPAMPPEARSLSALTFALSGRAEGFPLIRHCVFFSNDYPAEFADLAAGRLPAVPTVYVCAQDRHDEATASGAPERLFCLVNAPPLGDIGQPSTQEIDACTARTFALLERHGLRIEHRLEALARTGPVEFERLFPGTGGALYGRASHGWKASFERPGVRTRLPGLYLAGGSVHPGPGVPMAALSGRAAARSVLADWASTRRSPRTAMRGGTSMV